MAGITETIFRTLCKEHGADVVYSEMVSAEGIRHNSKNTKKLLFFNKNEGPIGIQLFGAHAQNLAYAAAFIEETVQPDFIDLNCGCPVPKVTKKNGGSALLKDPKLFHDILTHMVKSVTLPVTVKIRSGWTMNQWIDREYAKIAEDCGVAAIALHPRSKTMGFSGHSFWERIALVKQAVTIPVIGNGDIITPKDGYDMLSQTQCDAIMIGRGALGNPWIFNQIRKEIKSEEYLPVPLKEKLAIALCHLKRFEHHYGASLALKEMKKHLAWYCRGMSGIASMKNLIYRAQHFPELEDIINSAKRNHT